MRSNDRFKDAVLYGRYAMEQGSGGRGLYATDPKTGRQFAEQWGGSLDRTGELQIAPEAVLLDLTKPELQLALADFQAAHPGLQADSRNAFADSVGADVLLIPYTTPIYVIRNRGVIVGFKGPGAPVFKERDAWRAGCRGTVARLGQPLPEK
jgi:hypothetical protein